MTGPRACGHLHDGVHVGQTPNRRTYLQNACVASLLIVCRRAKVHGARDVCRTTLVLAAGVQQQQCVGVNCLAAFGLSAVVNDGTVAVSACKTDNGHIDNTRTW